MILGSPGNVSGHRIGQQQGDQGRRSAGNRIERVALLDPPRPRDEFGEG